MVQIVTFRLLTVQVLTGHPLQHSCFLLCEAEAVDLLFCVLYMEIIQCCYVCRWIVDLLFFTLLADMLSQYVEVEQLGPVYVCDKCNGMADAFS